MKNRIWKPMTCILSVALLASLVLTACGGTSGAASGAGTPPASGSAAQNSVSAENPSSGDKIVIRMGCATVLPSHPNQFMEELKAALESKSDEFSVELYPANQLGSNAQMIQGLQNGTVQAVVLPVGFFTTIAPELNVLELPALIPSSDMQYEMLNNSDVGTAFRDSVATQGMTPMSYLWCIEKEFLLKKEVHSMADMKGLKLRSTDASVAQNEITSYGCSPVSMSSGDVAMGLQQGSVDGLISDVTFMSPLKLYESAPYIIQAPLNPQSNCVMFSNILLDSLSADQLKLLEDTIAECRESVYGYTKDYIADSRAEMLANGAVDVPASQEFLDELHTASKVTHEQLLTDMPQLEDLYNQVKAYVEENS